MNTTPKNKLYISCPVAGRSEEAIRHDMVRKHIHSLGYKTEFKWRDRNVYRLNIYWNEGGCSK